jgi:hypothetical protein
MLSHAVDGTKVTMGVDVKSEAMISNTPGFLSNDLNKLTALNVHLVDKRNHSLSLLMGVRWGIGVGSK